MIPISQKIKGFDRIAHGYLLAKKHFTGEFLGQIFLTVYDQKLKKSSTASIFLTKNEIFLFLEDSLSDPVGLYQMQKSDLFTIFDEKTSDLKEILNATGGAQILKVESNYPISYINLNNKYLLLLSIDNDMSSNASFYLYEQILVGKDYLEKNIKTLKVIQAILNSENITDTTQIQGISPLLSKFNTYFVLVSVLIVGPAVLISLTIILAQNPGVSWVPFFLFTLYWIINIFKSPR